MALTRAQLLMGNSSEGIVLPGQVQGVKQGPGITIAPDGTISVNSQTVVGLMKMGQTLSTATAAYNRYEWPVTTGTPGQQVTITAVSSGITYLEWGDPDQIPWTSKGQLVVGTGFRTRTLLDVGIDGSILIADSSTVTGLNYTSNYVSTTSAQGAANIPAGLTTQRPAIPNLGAFRYNSDTTSLEFWNGSAWETVASSPVNGFVEKTSDTGSAVLPAGTTAQRDTVPAAGFFRFNDDTDGLEFFDGTSWQKVSSSATGSFVAQSVPNAGTPSAIIPGGTSAQRQTFPSPGFLRWNTDLLALEVWNGTTWDNTSDEVDSFSAGITGFTPAVPTKGNIVLGGTLNIQHGGTNATTAVQAINNLLPVQAGNNGFYLVTNGTNVSWQAPPPAVTTFSAGTTGFNPSVATSGAVTLSGTLNISNGGTNATTRNQAINNLLPSQGGQAGRYLTTDGTDVGWSAITSIVTSFSAGTTGLTPAVNTTGAIVMGGILNIASGGTGASTRNSALNNLLPAQGGSPSYVLTTDGANASWQPAGGGGGVTQIIAGTNVTISPAGGTGAVTINATGGGGGGVTQIVAGSGISIAPAGGTGVVTITNTGGGGGGGGDVQIFTSSGNWTKPASGTAVIIAAWAGGGGGGGGGQLAGGGGGGEGLIAVYPFADVPATMSITVGAGGPFNGQGGDTTVGSLFSLGGGAVGPNAGGGGFNKGGFKGGDGGWNLYSQEGNTSGGTQGSSWGGGGGGNSDSVVGGVSRVGGNGGGWPGQPGIAPGGGGSDNSSGARGEVRILVV